eukprot:CAMPEP_0194205484 /NCGR_PEP_ID=MMETSP0156-20130528/4739_1 /TAXON_ID=33649 /ORGANISM="Thalassionema nitzschioides, Strain L26-B" /LENGTH=340 /DNA_ID=CAMNT_0038931761 /DNA_START=83 /DNA_END=1105 /DNA_ORIENTATION=+
MMSRQVPALSSLCIFLLVLRALDITNIGGYALTFRYVYFDNDEQDFKSRGWLDYDSLFQQNLEAVSDIYCDYLDADDIELVVQVKADRYVPRAGSTFNLGRYLGKSNKTGLDLWEPAPLTKILGKRGQFNSFEIVVSINAEFVESAYWFDPTPWDRYDIPVPRGRSDFVSIMLHEIGHGLGFAGTINFDPNDPRYGTYEGKFNYLTPFDELTSFAGDGYAVDVMTGLPNPMSFDGAISKKIYNGNAIPLANVAPNNQLFSQNFYHLGDCDSPVIVQGSVMTGCFMTLGPDFNELSCLDLAVLADLGYPLKEDAFDELCETSSMPHTASRHLASTGILGAF